MFNAIRETELYLINERNIPNAYLLPLIFYRDSSNAAEIGNLSINTVIMTLGIFESKLQNKDVAKEVIAYLPKFEVLHCNKIVRHLINVCKYSKTKALDELKKFKMMVNNLWWGKIVEIITFAWNKGCAMRILGNNNLCHFFPCISFFNVMDRLKKKYVVCMVDVSLDEIVYIVYVKLPRIKFIVKVLLANEILIT